MARAKKVKIGIVGCGAIGSRMAKSVQAELKGTCRLTAIYDIDKAKALDLSKNMRLKGIVKNSAGELIKSCDFMIEAVSAQNTRSLIQSALKAKKNVLSMSVGKILNAAALFNLAHKNNCHLLIPSGAIAGIDAVKGARLAGIDTITLTTRKPLTGFAGNPYLIKKKINLAKIRRETVLFDGPVADAVRYFPQNINVAATLALASGCLRKLRVRILTSPHFTANTHEITLNGPFGRITTRTENVACPDNPKTSYLAVLSGLQTLKQYTSGIFIGT